MSRPDRWREVKALFQAAVELPAAQRPDFLATSAATTDVRAEVERLLAAHDEAGDSLEAPPRLDDAEAPPSHVGPYRILRELGQGGMGVVYLATRDDQGYHREVAIKVIKRGMDSAEIVRRFQRERRILAALEHSSIARLYDGGTTAQGLPYFVMERVEGEPIDAYCERRGLSVDERVRLLCATCDAVQAAHQRLVVHRDLKPGNILVTAEGVPKLLDFGIAKLLEGGGEGTADWTMHGRLLTPEYASPEQIRGEPITTASDVYALGIILYRLLTGRRPHQSTPRDTLWREALDREPQRPSSAVAEAASDAGRALSRRLHGDLDNIVLKAIAKEPKRRYGSATELAEDLCRHLEGLPIRARAATRTYRATKFVRRHRIGVAASALLVASLIAGLAATAWQARVAHRRFEDLRHLTNTFLFDFHDAIRNLPGSTAAREMVVTTALAYLDRMAYEAGGDLELLVELAAGYERLGDVQGLAVNPNRGELDLALRAFERAVVLRKEILRRRPTDFSSRLGLARALERMALTTTQVRGVTPAVTAAYKRIVALLDSLPSDGEPKTLADAHVLAAHALAELEQPTAADRRFRECVRLLEERVADTPGDVEAQQLLQRSYRHLYSHRRLHGVPGNLEGPLRRALAINEALVVAQPDSVDVRQALAETALELGRVRTHGGAPAEAVALLERATSIEEALVREDAKNSLAARTLAVVLHQLGESELAAGDSRRAHEAFRQAAAAFRGLGGRTSELDRLSRLALAAKRQGETAATLAAETEGAERSTLLSDSCAALRQSLEAFTSLAAQPSVGWPHEAEAAEVRRRAAECPAL